MEFAFVIIPIDELIRSDVPNHHSSSPVLSLGNGSFEVEVPDGMVFGRHGEATLLQSIRHTFGNGPRFQHAIHLQPEIIMKMTGRMLLDYKFPLVARA